ncbi:MAG: AmmeMemoRadiSam system radical SAM enzyme [bacterium]|nr:AmmeMemoRadiSam system radical SAM enzyme [bacterium]
MKESKLCKNVKENVIQCLACNHYCVLNLNEFGKCGVRQNLDGKLYALNYGKLCALNIDPIEKKPLFHFLPGTLSLSLASEGCNFSCANCQNWSISQGPKINKEIKGEIVSINRILEIAQKNKTLSISYTYTEPTVFVDFAFDLMKKAKKMGLKNVWVSNGFMSIETLEMISSYLDAINVDLKSFSEKFYEEICNARLKPVLENLKKIKQRGIWLEITTLIIPTLNDSEEEMKKISEFIKSELGPEVPLHITQFSPSLSWKLKNLEETTEKTLVNLYKTAKEVGLKYVYTGNIPGLDSENTLCPKCGNLLVERFGYIIKRFDKAGFCPKCNYRIEGLFN